MSRNNNHLKAAYMPVNQAWAVTLGDNIIGIGPQNTRFFDTFPVLRDVLARCGLTVSVEGAIRKTEQYNGEYGEAW